MTIHAVIYWDSGREKSISSMIFDENNFSLLQEPRKMSCLKAGIFDEDIANKAINEFFDQFDSLDRNIINVRYKSVSPISSASRWKNNTGKDSLFVDNMLRNKFAKISLIKPPHRMRSDLTDGSLKMFVEALINLGLMTEKNNAFKHKLWALVVGATNKNVKTKALKKLFMIAKKISRISVRYEQPYQEFLDQILTPHSQ